MYFDSAFDMNHSFLLLLVYQIFSSSLLCTSVQFSSAVQNCHLLIWLMCDPELMICYIGCITLHVNVLGYLEYCSSYLD
jgi:hypothetical protein